MQKDKTRDKLLGLLAQGKKYTQGELAKELGTKQSAISKQLKRMEKRGWVMGHGATSNRYFELTKNGISASQNPSQNGISRASKSDNGISYTGNVHLVINARAFKKLIEGAVNLKGTEKALLMVKPEGIEIRQMNSSAIAMIVARIPKAQFSSYRLGSPEGIGIDLEMVSRLTEDMPNDEELTITLQEENGKKRLKLDCGGHHNSVLTESGIRAAEKIPIVPFKSVVEIDGKLLQKSIHDMAKASGWKRGRGHTIFKITKENLILRMAGDDGEEISRIFDKAQVKLKADAQEQKAMYNSEYIEGMLKILKKNVPVTIQLTTNEPIGISYHMDGVEFAYYMAPYMENE